MTYDRRDMLAGSLADFLKGFYSRHPKLKKYRPTVKEKSSGGTSGHGEARQHGREVWVFPKFWDLSQDLQDFVFAHELGHYAKSLKNPTELMDLAQQLGVDVWDTSSLPYGQFNQEEAFADSFAAYYLNPSELKSRYPKWYLLVEMMLGKKVRVPPAGDFPALYRWADKVFAMINKDHSTDTPEEKAMFAAATLGRQAKRLGFNPEGLEAWLSEAYGRVWVKKMNLNPGMDLKDIRKVMLRSFEK